MRAITRRGPGSIISEISANDHEMTSLSSIYRKSEGVWTNLVVINQY